MQKRCILLCPYDPSCPSVFMATSLITYMQCIHNNLQKQVKRQNPIICTGQTNVCKRKFIDLASPRCILKNGSRQNHCVYIAFAMSLIDIRTSYLSHILKAIDDFEIYPARSYRNCHRGRYLTTSGRGIGYSFQLAITAPLYSIIGYCITTAQSQLQPCKFKFIYLYVY